MPPAEILTLAKEIPSLMKISVKAYRHAYCPAERCVQTSHFNAFLDLTQWDLTREHPHVCKHSPQVQAVECAPPFRVLVVEDGKGVAEVMAMFFEMEGMETAVAFDGMEAVDKAEVFQPHLICMDLSMPRMGGIEAARRIREKSNDVVIVALCGWDDEDSRRCTAEAGFNEHLIKPLTPDVLRKMIGQYLPNQRTSPSVMPGNLNGLMCPSTIVA